MSEGVRRVRRECERCQAVFYSIIGPRTNPDVNPARLCTDCRYQAQRDAMAFGQLKSWPAKRRKK